MMVATKDAAAVPAAAPTSTRIHPLPKAVVDRIAAGEVVQRPASVAKELIENCLDADASTIDVQAQAGGLRLLTVTDDGVGISPPDLQLAATRFATSKLVYFEDLKSIRTFGFRGEALASTSMVARVTITSRRRKRKAAGVAGAVASSSSATAKLDADEAKFSTSCAYKQSYKDGVPNTSKPTPSAGREGTVIKVEDLFYNVPSRRRAFAGSRKEAEEYTRVLSVAQRYAVHRAGRGVGVVCRKKGANADLNTPSLPSVRALKEKRLKAIAAAAASGGANKSAEISKVESERATRDVIGHIFGSSVAKELLTLHSEEGNVEAVSISALEAMREQGQQQQKQQQNGANGDKSVVSAAASASASTLESAEMEMATENNGKENDSSGEHQQSSRTGRYEFAYKAFGLITNGSFCAPKSSSAFVLFINDRLVESAPLRRAVESVYADSLPRGAKPFVYLALELPGPHVDVNVHPTKREVAFLHEDRLCDALARTTKEVLGSAQASRTFYAQAVLPQGMTDAGTIIDDSSRAAAIRAKAISKVASQNGADSSDKSGDKDVSADDEDEVDAKGDSNEDSGSQTKKRKADGSASSTPSSGKKAYDPKRLVRTNSAAPAGALEPFLVPTQSQLSQGQLSQPSLLVSKYDAGDDGGRALSSFEHAENCEFARGSQSIDMTVPGAFALLCRCQVERGNLLPPIQNRNTSEADNASSATASSSIVRPKKITPVHCAYSSIQTLRNDVTARAHRDLTTKLRDSQFVGCVTRSRSLIQWGIELLMINHTELGRELFYQLALSRFGGAQMAELGGGGVNVKCAVEQAMQLEQDIASGLLDSNGIEQDGASCRQSAKPLSISETNNDLARQCELQLSDKAKMLEEYYSIRFRTKVDPATGKEALMLVGLPVLLEGHSPPPHALPLFLLRLATEVDWTTERPCFHDICTELGNFYAEIPFDLDPSNEEDTECQSNVGSSDVGDSGETSTSTISSAGLETDAKRTTSALVDQAAKHFVKHTLYPATSFLLVPPKDFANNGAVVKLAVLSSLYKVFERC